MTKARILVVDDSAVVRRIVSEVIAADPGLEVVGTAQNGRIALEKAEQLKPDLVTLDIEMPEMDGLTTLPQLRKRYPVVPVIMFSSLTERGAAATLDALSLGASDYLAKPSQMGNAAEARARVEQELLPKIHALLRRKTARAATPGSGEIPIVRRAPLIAPAQRPQVVVVGVSTGGPNALAVLVPALPRDLPVPVLIVQHMPAMFTHLLAERLDRESPLNVREASDGAPVSPGEVWIAAGGKHMLVTRGNGGVCLRLTDDPPENSCRPAADPLFRSACQPYGGRVLGVVLTGMGQDGRRGAEAIVEAGGEVLAQDERTSVVWGMPGAVARAGLATETLALEAIAEAIVRRVKPLAMETSRRSGA